MAIIEGTAKIGDGLSRGHAKVLRAFYDTAIESKEVGEVTLRGEELPKGAVIIDSLVNVETKLESGGEATVLVSAQSEADLQASKKVGEAPWSTATPKRGAVTATGTPVVTTAAKAIKAKIGTAALTAGKFSVVVTYLDLA